MTRMATGLILGSGWLLLLLYSPFAVFGAVVCLAGAMGLYEYFRMCLQGAEMKFSWPGVVIGLVPLAAALGGRIEFVALGLFASLLSIAVVALRGFSSLANGFTFVAKLAFGVFYIGFCLAHLTLTRGLPHGISWLIILTAVVVAADSGAYYAGSWFGKRKLLPAVSPGKTWVGAVGGLAGGVLTAVVLGGWLLPAVSVLKFLSSGLLLVGAGMVGDLLESIIKRSSGVKDSGGWLAGHGGLLDRGDSLLLAAPVLYYMIFFGIV